MSAIKNYVGSNPEIKNAIVELECFICDMENAELTDGSTVDCEDAVRAMNVIIDALNPSVKP